MQFKKHISILLIFFLLVSNSGMALTAHFCEGKLAAISAAFKNEEICVVPKKPIEKGCCSKPNQTHKKCCSDKKITLKSDTEKSTVKTVVFDLDTIFYQKPVRWNAFVAIPNSISSKITHFCGDANAPPLYLLYSQFTFYC